MRHIQYLFIFIAICELILCVYYRVKGDRENRVDMEIQLILSLLILNYIGGK